jgi:recombination protein RecA
MAAKKKKGVTLQTSEPTKSSKKKSSKKAAKKAASSPSPTFNFDAFKGALEKKSMRAVTKDSKKKVQTVQILTFADENVVGHVKGVVSSQSIAIDKSVGIGGLPRGRLIEVSGLDSTGKSTLVAHVVAQAQKLKGVAMVVDTEEKMDEDYVQKIGVKTKNLVIIQPKRKTFEAVLDAITDALDHWIEEGLEDIPLIIAWDSVGATPTASEYDKSMDDNAQVGGASKLLSGAMRTLTGRLAQSNAMLLAVNHVYTDIKTGFAARFGSKRVTYGGKAIRFHATVRLEFVRTGWVKLNDGTIVGIEVLCKPIKNNVAAPMNEQKLAILWGIGFDNVVPLYWKLQEHKYITGSGGWYRFATSDGEDVKFQSGFIGFGEKVTADPELFQKCVQIYNALP